MIRLFLLVYVYSYVGLCQGAVDEPTPVPVVTPKNTRDELLADIIKHPSQESHLFQAKMDPLITKHLLDINADYGITSFGDALRTADSAVEQSQINIIYPYVSNYMLYKRRKNALDGLTAIISDSSRTVISLADYEAQMRTFVQKFYMDLNLNNQQFNDIFLKRYPSMKAINIPSGLFQKYEIYAKNEKRKQARDNFKEKISTVPANQIEKFEDVITKFKEAFGITDLGMSKESLKRSVLRDLADFETPANLFEKIWPIYENYHKFKFCSEKRSDVVNLYQRDINPAYYTLRVPMRKFKENCYLSNTYEDATALWNKIKEVDPTTELSEIKFLFHHYKKYIILFKREEAKDNLQQAIDGINRPASAGGSTPGTQISNKIDVQLSAFKTSFDLSLKTLTAAELNPLLNEIKKTQTEAVVSTDILTEYNKYVDRENARIKTDALFEKIDLNKDIKSFELKNEMNDFIEACKFTENQKFTVDGTFLAHVRKLYSTVDRTKIEKIEPKYRAYIEYKQRIQNRNTLLTSIKSNILFTIRNNADDLEKFKTLHFPTDDAYPELDDFMKYLKEMDGIDEEDAQLLHPFYANYLIYKEKEDARTTLLTKHRRSPSAYIYTLKDETQEFLTTHHFELKTTLSKTNFDKYLDDQDLGILESDKNILFARYTEYLKYKRMVKNREELVGMINSGKKLSEMRTIIKDIVADFEITKTIAENDNDFRSLITRLDPDISVSDVPNVREKIIAYLELIARIPYKERLLEFVSLNPNPKSADFESYIKPFSLHYNLDFQAFSSLNDFHTYLQTQQDDIPEEESKTLFIHYQIFAKLQNRWNTRNRLFEFLEKEVSPPISQLFPLVELFVPAYEFTHNNFETIDEFRSITRSRDDTFEEKYVTALYEPVAKYLKFIDRVQKRMALIDFKTRRTDATVYQLDHYVNQVYEAYLLTVDILSSPTVFEDHVNELDYTMTPTEIETLHGIILNHVLIMDRIQIKDASLDMINALTESGRHHMTRMMVFFVNSYQLAGKKVYGETPFYDFCAQKDPTITIEESKKIYPYYLNYLDYAFRQIHRSSLLAFMENNPFPTYSELLKYMNKYIKSHGLLVHELQKYERFYVKNKAVDKDITKSEIESLWKAVQIFINMEEFIRDHTSVLAHNDVIYDHDFVRPSGISGLFYDFFRHFGAYPHYLPNGMSMDQLTETQKSFKSSYQFLTGIEYFRLRPGQSLSTNRQA